MKILRISKILKNHQTNKYRAWEVFYLLKILDIIDYPDPVVFDDYCVKYGKKAK